jgi:hypothetical protein
VNSWTPKPTAPGLYLYTSDIDKNLPLEFDGKNLWIRLPERSRTSGQRAIMFRPVGGVFWRIPDPPTFPRWETARADVRGRLVASGDLGGGSSFEIREAVKEPDRPRMLLHVEETAGVLDSHMPITGRWGWGKNLPECPPDMFKPFRFMDAMKDPITGKIEERAHAFEQDPDIHYPESEICKCGFHKSHPYHRDAPNAT